MHTSLSRRSRPGRASGRRRAVPLVVGAAVLMLALGACSDGPGNEGDLVIALTHNDAFTTAEAECIAGAVFDEYGEDEEALALISGAQDYEALNGADGVPGFDDFFRRAVSACTNS